MGVEVLRGTPVAEPGLGVGRDEADPAWPDRVHRTADEEFGLVVVEVQLPQVGQSEDVFGGGEAVDAHPGVHRLGREVQMEPHGVHSENRPPVSDYSQLQRRDPIISSVYDNH